MISRFASAPKDGGGVLEQALSFIPKGVRTGFWCSVYTAGVSLALVGFSFFQSKIFHGTYNGATFTDHSFTICCTHLATALIGLFVMTAQRISGTSMGWGAPAHKYAIVAMFHVVAVSAHCLSLRRTSFEVQLVGLGCKMAPVVFWALAAFRLRVTSADVWISCLVSLGAFALPMTGAAALKLPHEGQPVRSTHLGIWLLCLSIAVETCTWAMQEKLFKQYGMHAANQLFYINGLSTVVFLGISLGRGELQESVSLCLAHPGLLADIVKLGSAGAIGLFFLFLQLQGFGALIVAATMNMRQVIFLYLTYRLQGLDPNFMQFTAVLFVFCPLAVKACLTILYPPDSDYSTPAEKERLLAKGVELSYESSCDATFVAKSLQGKFVKEEC